MERFRDGSADVVGHVDIQVPGVGLLDALDHLVSRIVGAQLLGGAVQGDFCLLGIADRAVRLAVLAHDREDDGRLVLAA